MTTQTSRPVSRKSKAPWIACLVVIALVIAGVCCYEFFKYDFFPKRFGVVDAGLVFRSGQISPRLIKQVLEEHKIKTIVDLQGEKHDAAHDAEQQAARELGINYYRYPLSGDGTGKIEHYAEALQTLVNSEKAGKPVLVHCSAGTQRTGVAVAYYQMLIENKPPVVAYREMQKYGWSPTHDAKAERYINSHMSELAQMLVDRGIIAHVPNPLPKLP